MSTLERGDRAVTSPELTRHRIWVVRREFDGSKVGRWLLRYDPFGDPPGVMPYRTGRADFTDDLECALSFSSSEEAIAFWQQTHPTVPQRPDGQPNRPLMAYTIEIVWFEAAR